MSVHQKLVIILENKVVKKLSLEKNVFNIMLIIGQKSCFLGPTIFKIPQPN